MRDIYEIRRADANWLLSLARQRVASLPILRRIYDDEFLANLVQHKNDFDNLLLLWLVIDNRFDVSTAIQLLEDIEKNLELFNSERDFNILKAKFRQWNTSAFESAVVELEFASEYFRKGFKIDLEPELPNNRKGDFCATKEDVKIYFEVKTIYEESTIDDQAIINELSDRFEKLDDPFIISIDLKEGFKRGQSVKASRYLQQQLRDIKEKSPNLPFSFDYPDNNSPIMTVDVIKRVADNEKGYISGFTHGGGIKGDWRDLRSKIASGVGQLDPNCAGVIIVKPHGLETTKYDIENALYGDLKVNFFGTPKLFRSGDRIFAENKNNRLSAVIYYQERLHEKGFTKKKIVYHNPFAAIRLSADLFKGENITQY